MKNFFKFTWFPVVMVFVLAVIFGSATFIQAKNKNNPTKNNVNIPAATLTTENLPETSKQDQIVSIESLSKKESQDNTDVILPTNIPSFRTSPTPTVSQKSKPKLVATSLPTAIPTPSSVSTSISTPTPQKLATVSIQNLGDYQVEIQDDDTAFSILLRAAQKYNFTISYQDYGDMGAFINCIGGICGGKENYYWMLYYNGRLSGVGASSLPINDRDITTWKFENY